MKKHLIGLKASKFTKFLLVSVAALSNFYGLLLLVLDKEGWDPFILSSIVFLGLSYVASICEKHFKSKIKDLVLGLTVEHLIEEYKSKLGLNGEGNEEGSEEVEKLETNFKFTGSNTVSIKYGDCEKTMAISQDKDGFYLTELPKEIEFKGIRIFKENLNIEKVNVVLDVVANKSKVTKQEKADDN